MGVVSGSRLAGCRRLALRRERPFPALPARRDSRFLDRPQGYEPSFPRARPRSSCIGPNLGLERLQWHRCSKRQRRGLVLGRPSRHRLLLAPLPEGGDVVKADPVRGRVFVACYSGAIAAVQALSSGQYKKIADAHVEKKVHSLAVDPETGYLYVPEEQEKGAPASRLIVYSLPGETH